MEKKYDLKLMQYITVAESMTRSKIKDCFMLEDVVYFIVEPGEIAKAIGKSGANVRMLGNALKKKIKFVEFNNELPEFIKNLIYPLKADDIGIDGSIVNIRSNDTKTKGLLIGRNRQNLSNLKDILGRYFKIKDITVR